MKKYPENYVDLVKFGKWCFHNKDYHYNTELRIWFKNKTMVQVDWGFILNEYRIFLEESLNSCSI